MNVENSPREETQFHSWLGAGLSTATLSREGTKERNRWIISGQRVIESMPNFHIYEDKARHGQNTAVGAPQAPRRRERRHAFSSDDWVPNSPRVVSKEVKLLL